MNATDAKLRCAPEGFIAWFRANYRDVVDFGSDPAWHAKAIYKNAMHHARAALTAPVAAQPEAVQAAARRLLDKDAPDIYAGDVRLVAEAVLATPVVGPPPDELQALREQVSCLRANLRVMTDSYETLIEEGKFPGKGRSADDKDAIAGWWEQATANITRARTALDHPEEAPQWKI